MAALWISDATTLCVHETLGSFNRPLICLQEQGTTLLHNAATSGDRNVIKAVLQSLSIDCTGLVLLQCHASLT